MRDYDIESDLKQEKFQSIKLVQGDRGNKIKINVYEDGQPVKLTGCSITAKYKRADGEIINDGVIENIHDNSFDAVMDSSITKVAGTLKMLFTIEKDAVKVSAFLLLADVREGIGESSSSGGSAGGGEVTGDLSDYYKKIETYSRKEIDAQFKDIANVLSNIQTEVEVTKDILLNISDNTSIPDTAQQQEVVVEFKKGSTGQIPIFTNLITDKTAVQINNVTNELLVLEEIEYKGTGNSSGTTAYFRVRVSNLIYNHLYYYSIWLKSSDNNAGYSLGISTTKKGIVTEEYKKYSCLEKNSINLEGVNTSAYIGYFVSPFIENATYYMKKPMCIDLTALYGEGNEPTLEEFEDIIGNAWCLGTYTPSGETVSNDFTIKSYKADNSLIDSLDSKTDTAIKIIGGGYVNITADILPKSAILKNVKYTEKHKLEIEEKGLNIGSYKNALTLINSNKDNVFMYILIEGEIQKPIWHIGNGIFIDAVGAVISL
jgi:hypothetical protein